MVNLGGLAAAAMMLFMAGCDHGYSVNDATAPQRRGEYAWQVPPGFPIPAVPADNPMTWEKVELGRELFYDPRLSGDGSVSCASCHKPELAFTDGRRRAKGIQGNLHPRSAMSLTNVAYNATLGWDDPELLRLEDQILIPLNNTRPPEMGASGREAEIIARLMKDRRLDRLFQRAFPQEKSPVTMRNAIYALASFERTLISGNSPYDRWAYGALPEALDRDQRKGARLFFSKRLNCFRCHAGFNLSGPVRYAGSEETEARFHNTALDRVDEAGAYSEPNTGLHRHTGRIDDKGKFRAPTLRNIALTAPYMHDGSIATLGDVLDHYAAGGIRRYVEDLKSGPNSQARPKGAVEKTSIQTTARVDNIDPLITGFELSAEEKRQLIAFLHALTDHVFVQQSLGQAIKNR